MWCAGTKKLNEADVVREHAQHMLKLHKIKPRVNTNAPKSMPHLQKNLKSKSIKKEQNISIQNENQLLLKKMFEIDSRPPLNLSQSMTYKSLNRNNRIQNLSKITMENKGILNRLKTTKSAY